MQSEPGLTTWVAFSFSSTPEHIPTLTDLSTPGKPRAERVGKQPAFRGLVREPPVEFLGSWKFYGFAHIFASAFPNTSTDEVVSNCTRFASAREISKSR
jgi:hypothetical protein